MKKYLISILAFISFSISLYFSLINSPPEEKMGELIRILYIHVPFAWYSFVSFTITFICSILYFLKREDRFDKLGASGAEIGFIFITIAILTGSLWAKSVWGVFWVWEPRLTTTLILWFLYLSYLLLRKFIEIPDKRARISGVLGIIFYVDIPIIYFSVYLWRSVHPLIFKLGKIGIETPMQIALFSNLVSFLFLFLLIFDLRYKIYLKEKIL
ncbi:MAG: cytochrome c biogenesis protein [candidate division WOR-3 bacterium]